MNHRDVGLEDIETEICGYFTESNQVELMSSFTWPELIYAYLAAQDTAAYVGSGVDDEFGIWLGHIEENKREGNDFPKATPNLAEFMGGTE